jgi:hypothetical protein
VAPGGSIRDAIAVTNASSTRQRLAISPSLGTTASISGYSYVNAFSHCRRASCWINGLPTSVTVPAKGRVVIPFTVTVPAGTAKRQYLAGISVEPEKKPQPAAIGSAAGIGVKAAIATRVNVGVAITVGSASELASRLVVEGVKFAYSGTSPTLQVHERNTGQTFLAAKGTAVCVDGAARNTYPVVSSVVLPQETAVLPVLARGLRRGASVRCTVKLVYGKGVATPAAWRGTVKVPAKRPAKLIQTGPHTFSSVPKPRVPRWAIGVIAGGAFLVVVLLVFIVVLLMRRRPSPATPT